MRNRIWAIWVIGLVWFANGQGWAQVFPSQVWHEGKIVLVNGDTLTGVVKYDLERDIVQIRGFSGKVEVFTARKLSFFEIYDRTDNRYRQFYALPFKNRPNYEVPVIFELLYEGKLTLLTRESIVLQPANFGNGFGRGNFTTYVLDYDYFFLEQGNDISRFSGKKKDLLHLMRKRQNEVKAYIKDNKIRYEDKGGLVRIVAFFNSLITS